MWQRASQAAASSQRPRSLRAIGAARGLEDLHAALRAPNVEAVAVADRHAAA